MAGKCKWWTRLYSLCGDATQGAEEGKYPHLRPGMLIQWTLCFLWSVFSLVLLSDLGFSLVCVDTQPQVSHWKGVGHRVWIRSCAQQAEWIKAARCAAGGGVQSLRHSSAPESVHWEWYWHNHCGVTTDVANTSSQTVLCAFSILIRWRQLDTFPPFFFSLRYDSRLIFFPVILYLDTSNFCHDCMAFWPEYLKIKQSHYSLW